jgi:hypothetical protein
VDSHEEYFYQQWLAKRQGRWGFELEGNPRAMERINPDNPTAGSRNQQQEKYPAPGGRLITHFHASNFKLPDS